LLSDPELRFYRRLQQAFPEYLICPQVQLQQAVRFKKGRWNASIANSFNQLSIDFLVVKSDTTIVAAVELDDASHDRAPRRSADARKTHALSCAGIPLLRWNVRQIPEPAAIVTALGELTSPTARLP